MCVRFVRQVGIQPVEGLDETDADIGEAVQGGQIRPARVLERDGENRRENVLPPEQHGRHGRMVLCQR